MGDEDRGYALCAGVTPPGVQPVGEGEEQVFVLRCPVCGRFYSSAKPGDHALCLMVEDAERVGL